MNIDTEKLLDEAYILISMQMYQQAIAKYNYILQHITDCDEALLMRGEIRAKIGDIDNGITDIEQSIQINSVNDSAFIILGRLYQDKNDDTMALANYRRALAINKNNTEAVKLLVQLCKTLGNRMLTMSLFDKAEDYFNIALDYCANEPVILYRLALVLRGKGKIQESIKLAEKVINFLPDHVRSKAHIASCYELLGELEEGTPLINALYHDYPEHPMVSIVYAHYALRNKKQHDGITALIATINNKNIQIYDLITALMFLGKLYDSIEEYDLAFKYYAQANGILDNQNKNYSPLSFRNYISSMINYFTRDKYASIAKSENKSDKVIFIIGMPRSGTSLIEQIISTHSDVFGAGELNYVNKLVDDLQTKIVPTETYPDCLDKIDINTMNKLADQLILDITKESTGSIRIIDKMPHNFLHIGLIHKLLPKAKIIHCKRDPVDTCLSCYFQYFAGGHPYANNLHSLGLYYRDYERLMNHWSNELNIPVLSVSYEDIVADTRNEVNKIMEFIHLSWQEKCLEFYKNKRTVATSSYNQVNQKIYTNSVGRWKNYAPCLAPLLSALKE